MFFVKPVSLQPTIAVKLDQNVNHLDHYYMQRYLPKQVGQKWDKHFCDEGHMHIFGERLTSKFEAETRLEKH